MFLKTTPGYILCILLPFLLLILSQGLNCIRLFRQYKKEQMDEMKVEREKIEQERAESQRMMAELMELEHLLAMRKGILLHASVVCVDGEAVLFTAPSQTGKSTQASL